MADENAAGYWYDVSHAGSNAAAASNALSSLHGRDDQGRRLLPVKVRSSERQ